MNTKNGQEITKIDKNCMKRTKSTLLGQNWVVKWEISKPIFWLVRGEGGSSPSPPINKDKAEESCLHLDEQVETS